MVHIALPAGSHYALMWGIPDEYAGMTASMLQRSRAFVKYAGVEVTVLTLEHRDSYDEVRARLQASGALVDGMHIRNLWEDARDWGDERLKQAVFDGPVPDWFEPLGDRGTVKSPLIHELRRENGRHEQIDYFRPDGTMLASDRRHGGKQPYDRSVVLCDRQGVPMGSWNMAVKLYWMWLDTLPREPHGWFIADSKTSANTLVRYIRDDSAIMHVVRGSHLNRDAGADVTDLSKSRRFVMQNIHAWDAAVFLTESQKADLEQLLGPQANLHVIPNSRNVPAELTQLDRPAYRGVMLSSLIYRKRIDHAIRAMAIARGKRVWWRGRLDVWGRGPLAGNLRKHILRRLAPVRLRGYSTRASEQFSAASFSLLTSSAEAFGNVLIESMGRGCVPISYDIRYGPSDVITHGVDGFLVENGDVQALGRQIREFVAMPPTRLAEMRTAGHRRAQDFSDERVMEQWSAMMRGVAQTRGWENRA